ncbi:ferrochelatase [Paenibacillus senegalensis]|uniref:ferrochelatase n=1 Tax=Paenibacillus senegalensis TaxID=1465766 RepID=UPI00028815CE|nr:ferrochelatase [Paenibacillus senegalensis]
MIGIIIFAYGAPNSVDDLESYYTHIRYGKKPTAEQLEAARQRFARTGTADLLGAVTQRQAQALELLLKPYFTEPLRVYTAFKHTPPFAQDTVSRMVEEGVTRILTLPISPLYSKTGAGQYQRKVHKALTRQCQGEPIAVIDVDKWHNHPAFVRVMSKRVNTAVQWLSEQARLQSVVIFTAHSQPGAAESHERYHSEFAELAQLIAQALGLSRWTTAYRSAGAKAELWSGPDVKEVIQTAAANGIRGIVTCDLLSVTANIEALFDMGFDCQELCQKLNLEFVRTEFLNDSFDFMNALAAIVRERLQQSV